MRTDAQRTDLRRQRADDKEQGTGTKKIMIIKSAKELTVYQKSYALAMRVFEISKSFPKEEVYALSSQIRRSSRSVPMNLREAWAKRRYEAHFVSKLTDCDGESNETDTSLDFALNCGYIDSNTHTALTELNTEIGKMLGKMIQSPQSFLIS